MVVKVVSRLLRRERARMEFEREWKGNRKGMECKQNAKGMQREREREGIVED